MMTFPDDWSWRVKVTSDNTKVAAAIKGLAIDLSNIASADFWDNVKSDGSDIRITTDEAGTSLVARDVVSIDTTGETGLIRLDTSGISTSADTDYYVYYGNASATEPLATDTYGRYNAYDSQKYLLLPYPETSGTTANDRTVRQNTGTANNSRVLNATGKLGKGADFTQGNDYIEIPHSGDFSFDKSSVFTIGCWVKTSMSSGFGDFIGAERAGSVGVMGYHLRIANSKVVFAVNRAGTGGNNVTTSANFNDNQWHRVTGVYNNSNFELFVDGVSQGTAVFTHSVTGGTTQDLMVGARKYSTIRDLFLNGFIDESFVYSGKALTANEDLTFFNNESDNSTFWTINAPSPTLGYSSPFPSFRRRTT